MSAWRRVVDYRVMKLSKLKAVKVVTHHPLSADEVLAYGAEIVVIATGSRWSRDGWNRIDRTGIPGADVELPYVLTPDQIMREKKTIPGRRLLIYDVEGYFMGPTLAEMLARDGHEVTLVTPFASVGPIMDGTGENLFLVPQLSQLGVRVLGSHLVKSIGERSVTGYWAVTPDVPVEWQMDAVILVTCRVPEEAIYQELRRRPEALQQGGVEAVYRIGDCLAPRLYVADAIFDGHRLAHEIDLANPAEALPYLRERAIV